MADVVQVSDSDQDLSKRKNLKKQLKEAIAEYSDPPAQDEVATSQPDPEIIKAYYATEAFRTMLGNTGMLVPFAKFEIITDEFKIHWLLKQGETRIKPLDVDAIQCPKCQNIFAGKPCSLT